MSGQNRYMEERILSADPVTLVCMLYEHAILAVEDAREHLLNKDIAARARAISKAMAIIGELEGALNHEAGGDISGNLARLYQYMRERLVSANTTQKPEPLLEVERLLKTVGDAWEQIRPKTATEPVPSGLGAAGMAWPGAYGSEDVNAPHVHGWSV